MRERATTTESLRSNGSGRGSRRRRCVLAAEAAIVVVGLLAASTSAAFAAKKPVIPSQSQIDQANAAAQAKSVAIGQAEAALAAANASLDALNDHVEALVEAYDGATAKVEADEQVATAAQAELKTAIQAKTDAEVQMNVFAADSYRGAGSLDKLSALVTADSPSLFLTRAATLSALARHQQSVIAQMENAETVQTSAQTAANLALSNQQAAAAAAGKDEAVAMAAVTSQTASIATINANQQDLQAQLAVLKGTAKDLASARVAGLKLQAAEAAAAAAAAKAAAAAAAAAAARAAELRQEEAAELAASSKVTSTGSSSGGPVSTGGVVPPGGHSISTPAERAEAVAFAESQVGVWYRWAGIGDVGPTVTSSGTQNVIGYDCSGLTMRAYQAAGISLAHFTGDQWNDGVHVAQSQIQVGDLVFFATNTNDPSTIHHVGIYIGNGQMVDAPTTGQQVGIHNAFRSDYIGAVEL